MKNKILKGTSYVMFLMMLLSMAAMDSKDLTLPIIGLCVSVSWLFAFAYANSDGSWL